MVRKTENQILGRLADGVNLTTADQQHLLAKIDKGQSKSRARVIAQHTELQYHEQFAALSPEEQAIVKRAVSDYTSSSDAINASCRSGAPNLAARNIDAAFGCYAAHDFDRQRRVVYRLLSYKPPAVCPYGAAKQPQIAVGDLISDEAFLSASEHRQFLVNGVLNAPAGTRYVKFVIAGRGGINISGGGIYTNENEQKFLELSYSRTHRFRTAQAGQAEILFPRGTILRVESMVRRGDDVHVFASMPAMRGMLGVIKNAYTGIAQIRTSEAG